MTHADTDRSAMGRALELAREAGHTGEVPVGAVVIDETGSGAAVAQVAEATQMAASTLRAPPPLALQPGHAGPGTSRDTPSW